MTLDLLNSSSDPDFLPHELHVFIRGDGVELQFYLEQLSSMTRAPDEPIKKALRRLELTLQKKSKKKKKKSCKTSKGVALESGAGSAAGSNVECWLDGTLIDLDDESVTNESGWCHGMKLIFPGDVEFTVVIEPPAIATISTFPTKTPIVGLPVCPVATTCNCDSLEVQWLQQHADLTWETLCDTKNAIYTPASSHVGAKIKVYVTPVRRLTGAIARGRTVACYVPGSVQAYIPEIQEGILHTRRKFVAIPRGASFSGTLTTAPLPRPLQLERGLGAVDRDMGASVADSFGRHFEPLFGPGREKYASFVNTKMERCATEACVSNASAYHMDRVKLVAPSLDYGASSFQDSRLDEPNGLVRKSSDFRVVCYNILADPFATSQTAIRELFPYCSEAHLASEYRLQLLLQEMLAYDADVLLLQECDEKVASKRLDLLNQLSGSRTKYEIYYTGKDTSVPEGCCTLVNSHAFECIGRVDLHIGASLKSYLENELESGISNNSLTKAELEQLRAFFRFHPESWTVLTGNLGMIAQLTVLRRRNSDVGGSEERDKLLCLSNTHLFYHPAAGYARLMQCYIVSVALHALAKHVKDTGSISSFSFPGTDLYVFHPECMSEKRDVAVVFAGDLNSTLETAVVEFLQTEFIEPTHAVWDTVDDFRWDRRRGTSIDSVESNLGDETMNKLGENVTQLHVSAASCTPPLLRNPFAVRSSNAGMTSASGYPQFTNFTAGFKDILDYIYVPISTEEFAPLKVLRRAPFPSEEGLSARTALPSAAYPSDHIALVVDMTFD